MNPEYSSDFLTFQKPLEWEKLFWENANAFDLSTGSLSGEEFQIQDRLKLHQWLIEDKFQFRFTYFAEKDYEIDQEHKVLELIYKFSPQWGISLSGETSFAKAEDDVGAAILFQPHSKAEHRAFYSYTDFSRNERNRDSDFFIEDPVRYGLVGRVIEGGWFYSYAFTHAPEIVWSFPDQVRIYESSDDLFEIHIQKTINDSWSFGSELLYDEFFEKEEATDLTSFSTLAVKRKRWLSRNEVIWNTEGTKLKGGLAYFYRDYLVNDDRQLFRDVLPYFGYGFRDNNMKDTLWKNELVLESTMRANVQIETRLNWRSAFEFKKQGELALLLSFDMDEFGTGRTWEGGNAQFRFWF